MEIYNHLRGRRCNSCAYWILDGSVEDVDVPGSIGLFGACMKSNRKYVLDDKPIPSDWVYEHKNNYCNQWAKKQ